MRCRTPKESEIIAAVDCGPTRRLLVTVDACEHGRFARLKWQERKDLRDGWITPGFMNLDPDSARVLGEGMLRAAKVLQLRGPW